ncbi:CatB-related O-acetyltransferase [Aeromonas veronii]
MLKKIFHYISLLKFKILWRKLNNSNHTVAGNIFPIHLVRVGSNSYGVVNIRYWKHPKEGLSIGAYVSIAENVIFILGGNHTTTGYMTYPLHTMRGCYTSDDSYSKGPIVIEDDVWIGFGSIILSGVTIGRGSVIAAGSIVTKSFPAFSVIAGNPAKLIKRRLSDEQISLIKDMHIESLKLEKLTDKDVDLFYQQPDSINVLEIKKILTR